jgi:hypothetical protein
MRRYRTPTPAPTSKPKSTSADGIAGVCSGWAPRVMPCWRRGTSRLQWHPAARLPTSGQKQTAPPIPWFLVSAHRLSLDRPISGKRVPLAPANCSLSSHQVVARMLENGKVPKRCIRHLAAGGIRVPSPRAADRYLAYPRSAASLTSGIRRALFSPSLLNGPAGGYWDSRASFASCTLAGTVNAGLCVPQANNLSGCVNYLTENCHRSRLRYLRPFENCAAVRMWSLSVAFYIRAM